jgi:hypothetical protein
MGRGPSGWKSTSMPVFPAKKLGFVNRSGPHHPPGWIMVADFTEIY